MTQKTLHAAGAGLAAIAATAPFVLASPVRADSSDPSAVLREIQQAFAEYRTNNDQRLAALERGGSDPLATERVETLGNTVLELQASLDQLLQAQAAQRLNGGAPGASAEAREYAARFDTYFRRGDGGDQLNALAVRAAMTTTSDPDGGYLVPVQMEEAVGRVLATVSVMRQLAQVQTISAASYKKLMSLGGAGAGWVGETEARSETATPRLVEMEFAPGEIYAKPRASQTLLDDARVDLEAWLAGEVSTSFAEQEGAAFITGNGVKKPRGLLDYDKVANGNYAWGSLGFIISGGSAGFASAAPWQALQDVIGALKTGYRANATWLGNRLTMSAVMKFKDVEDRPIWQPSLQAGQPATLMGYPAAEDDNMPDVGAGAFPLAFGDFRQGYLIVDRLGVRVLRDPFSAKPFVEFYTTKRVGGGVQNFEAIKLLKIAAS